MRYKILVMLLLCVSLAYAADWTPTGDINLRDYYEIKNATNISAAKICLTADSCRTTWPSVSAAGLAPKVGDGIYLYNDSTTMYWNASLNNITINQLLQFINTTGNMQNLLNDTGIYGTYNLTYENYGLYLNGTFNESLTDLLYAKLGNETWYNHTEDTYNLWNVQWSRTDNATYDSYAANVSINHTADVYTNWGKWFGNQTLDTYNNWGQWWNNQTTGAVDILTDVYGKYWVNQTAPLYTAFEKYWNNQTLGSIAILTKDFGSADAGNRSIIESMIEQNVTDLNEAITQNISENTISSSVANITYEKLNNVSIYNITYDNGINQFQYYINESTFAEIMAEFMNWTDGSAAILGNRTEIELSTQANITNLNLALSGNRTDLANADLGNATALRLEIQANTTVINQNLEANKTLIDTSIQQNISEERLTNNQTFVKLNNDTDDLSLHLDKDNWNLGSNWLEYDNPTLDFNESKLATVYYNATQSQAVAGTIDEGIIDYTQHPDGDYDGFTLNFTEASGAPGLDLRMNFTGVNKNFTNGVMRYKTSSLAGDYPIIQMWNYDDGMWEDYPAVSESLTYATITQPVFDSSDHLENDVAQMRIYKATNGNTNNHYFVDWVAIATGFGTPSGQETDPYSIHRDGNITLTNDWFAGLYYIIASGFNATDWNNASSWLLDHNIFTTFANLGSSVLGNRSLIESSTQANISDLSTSLQNNATNLAAADVSNRTYLMSVIGGADLGNHTELDTSIQQNISDLSGSVETNFTDLNNSLGEYVKHNSTYVDILAWFGRLGAAIKGNHTELDGSISANRTLVANSVVSNRSESEKTINIAMDQNKTLLQNSIKNNVSGINTAIQNNITALNISGIWEDEGICYYDVDTNKQHCNYTDQTGEGAGVGKAGDGDFLTNDTDTIYFDAQKLNLTINATIKQYNETGNLYTNFLKYWNNQTSPLYTSFFKYWGNQTLPLYTAFEKYWMNETSEILANWDTDWRDTYNATYDSFAYADTNASDICGADEVLDGDGDCVDHSSWITSEVDTNAMAQFTYYFNETESDARYIQSETDAVWLAQADEYLNKSEFGLNIGLYYNETETDDLLALQDECSEITGCVVGAITTEVDPNAMAQFTLYYNETESDNLLAGQDECSEITGCESTYNATYDAGINSTFNESLTRDIFYDSESDLTTLLDDNYAGISFAYADTNASTICAGTTTYLDGEGNCDDISTAYAGISFAYADTNASTICGADEVLDGDGDCVDHSSWIASETDAVALGQFQYYENKTQLAANYNLTNDQMKNLTAADCEAGYLVIGVENNGSVKCSADSGGVDSEVDPGWDGNYTRMKIDCAAGQQVIGIHANGSFECVVDATVASGMDYTNLALTNESEIFEESLNVSQNLSVGTGDLAIQMFWNGTDSIINLTEGRGYLCNSSGCYSYDAFLLDTDTTYTDLSELNDDIGVAADYDSVGDIPNAAPSDGDTTHFSLADEIYDWGVGLFLQAESDLKALAAIAGNYSLLAAADVSNRSWLIAQFGSADSGNYTNLAAADLSNRTKVETMIQQNITALNISGVFIDEKICMYDVDDNKINCNYTDQTGEGASTADIGSADVGNHTELDISIKQNITNALTATSGNRTDLANADLSNRTLILNQFQYYANLTANYVITGIRKYSNTHVNMSNSDIIFAKDGYSNVGNITFNGTSLILKVS